MGRTAATKASQSPATVGGSKAGGYSPRRFGTKQLDLRLVIAATGFKRLGLAIAALVAAFCGVFAAMSILISTDAVREAVKTEVKARTAFSDGARLYLAVPKRGDSPAELRIYNFEERSP